jgi:hypothetical protein
MADQQVGVNTGGGGYFAAPVTSGRDVIGRDKIVHGDEVGANKGLEAADLAQLFRAVYQQIDAPTGPRHADVEEVSQTVQRVEQEAGKGDDANAERIERWLRTLGEVAPDVLELAVNALTNPAALVTSAVRIVARKFQTQSA